MNQLDRTFAIFFASWLMLGIFALPAKATLTAASSAEEKRAFLLSLATPSSEKKLLYRWQTKKSGDALVAAGTFTDNLHSYFMNMPENDDYLKGGRGIYIAEGPYSGSAFSRGGDGGSLILVEIEKGMPTLDLTDAVILKTIEEHGISLREAHNLDPPVAVKYEKGKDWWVIKRQEGVKFTAFDGSNISMEDHLGRFPELANRRAKRIYAEAVRPHLLRQLESDFRWLGHPQFRDIVGAAHASTALERAAAQLSTLKELNELEKIIRASPLLQKKAPLAAEALIAAEARLSSTDEILSGLNQSTKEKSARLLEAKFRLMQSESELLPALGKLQEKINADPELSFLFDGRALRAQLPPVSSASAAKIDEILEKIHPRVTDASALLASAEGRPLLEQMWIWRVLERQHGASASPTTKSALEKFRLTLFGKEGKFIKQFSLLPAADKPAALRHAIPHLGAEGLIKVLKASYAQNYYDEDLAQLLASHEDDIRRWNPSSLQWREIADYASADPAKKLALLSAATEGLTAPAEALALLKPGTRDFSSEYQRELARILEENFPRFLEKNPNSHEVQQLIRLMAAEPEKQRSVALIAIGAAKNAQDYLQITTLPLASPEEQTAFKKFLHGDLDIFLRLQPRPAEIAQLKAFLGPDLPIDDSPALKNYLARPSSGFAQKCETWFGRLWGRKD